jgi:hypothetical protein
MGNCISISVKYDDPEVGDDMVFETPLHYTMVTCERTALEQKCDEIATEMLGIFPRAPIIRI